MFLSRISLTISRRSFELLVQNRPAPIHLDNDTTPRRPSGLAKRLPYRKADYSNIRYWTRKNYDDTRNENAQVIIHDAAAETTSLPFMEHEDGTTLTDEEAIKMRATARGVFAHFMQEGSAPAKWGQISVVGQDFFSTQSSSAIRTRLCAKTCGRPNSSRPHAIRPGTGITK